MRYTNPTNYNSAGFNTVNLTTQGFFILQPVYNMKLETQESLLPNAF